MNETKDNPCVVEPHNQERFGYMKCPNMQDDGSTWDYEYYKCAVCGKTYKLDYEEMK